MPLRQAALPALQPVRKIGLYYAYVTRVVTDNI